MKKRHLETYLLRDARYYPVLTLMSPDMLDGFLWWTKLAGLPPDAATLVYGGSDAFTRKGVSVRPWFAI